MLTHVRQQHSSELFSCTDKSPELYKCNNCDFETYLKVDRHEHIKITHETEEINQSDLMEILKCYNCRNCSFQTHSWLVLMEHIYDRCTMKRGLDSDKNIQGHDKTKSKNSELDSAVCLFKVKPKDDLKKQPESHRAQNIKWFQCVDCSYKSKTLSDVKGHIFEKHMAARKNSATKKNQEVNLNSVEHILKNKNPVPVAQKNSATEKNQEVNLNPVVYIIINNALPAAQKVSATEENQENLNESILENHPLPAAQKNSATEDNQENLNSVESILENTPLPASQENSATEENRENLNSVEYILKNNPLPSDQKLLIKQKGRPTPDLQINSTSSSKSRTYNRAFNKNIYDKYEWICGCPTTNKLFCFFCLLFKREVTPWTRQGLADLKHIADRAKKHENSVPHLHACMDFNLSGKIDIREQLSSAYVQRKLKCKEEVEKNRHILRRLIMCIRFCGAFELALRGHDEKISENPGICVGLINFAAELDSALAIHLNNSEVFKGTSKTIQNELLDAMFEVYRTELIKQIKSANFIALEADETTDTSNQQQMVVIIRYVFKGQICERFWSFIKPEGHTADELAKLLLQELQLILSSPSDHLKLIAQAYDGAAVMSGKNGVQAIIKKTYPHAHFIHCYAHQLNLIMERAAQCHRKVKIFFGNSQSFSSFFSGSPKRTAVLNDVVKRRLPRSAAPRWNFNNRMVNTLYENRDSFKDCLEKIIDGDQDSVTMSEACDLLEHLTCPEFLYWLKIFHFVMPHVEVFQIFLNQAQTSPIDSAQMQNAVEQFERQITRIRSVTDNIEPQGEEEPAKKRQKTASEDTRSAVAKEVCDNVLVQIKDRFDFKDHLSAAKLVDCKNFKNYRFTFPQEHLDSTVKSYPMLDSMKLKSELISIYGRDDMCAEDGVVSNIASLLVFISDNNLTKMFSETYKLVDIICTTPMSTSESESTLKRIKTFLRSTMSEDRLNALAVLSIEKNFIQFIPDFENKVIDVFSSQKNRKIDFLYK